VRAPKESRLAEHLALREITLTNTAKNRGSERGTRRNLRGGFRLFKARKLLYGAAAEHAAETGFCREALRSH